MKISTSNKKHLLPTLLSFLCLLAVWGILAHCMHAPLILPTPAATARALAAYARRTDFWLAAGATLLRSIVAFCIATLLGTAVGALCGSSPWLRAFFAFPVELVRAAPVVSFILIAVFWFTSGTVPIFVSVLAAFPIMTAAVTEGFSRKDEKLLEMAQVYRFTKRQQFRWITLPALIPPFCTGAVSAFGLTWKATIAGEVLCLPQTGTGMLMQTAQMHLETADVAAIMLVTAGLSFALERGAAFLLAGRIARAG